MIKSLEELIENRKKYQEGVDANQGFDDGLKKLLSNMYPDEAHFIYELLQNAEDKGAKEVSFRMYADKLEFIHDAGVYNKENLFNLGDIDSITNIGKSTKLDDPTSIGKFGVGFKSVFAYTSSPKIYSGDYSFEINNLVIPQIIPKDETLSDGLTKFIIPFNSKTKSLILIQEQVIDGLKNIKENSLLFLNNIEKINYELINGEKGVYYKVNQNNNVVKLVSNNDETYWLKFDKNTVINDLEDNKQKKCTVNIAFKLSKDKDNFKIIPVMKNNVFIYFPAEKETSNLKFLINAPFASTIARDAVRNTPSNKQLIQGISNLIKDALHKIKDYGLMDIDLLRVLPNEKNDIPSFYRPILDTVKQEFQLNEYFPTKDGTLSFLKNIYNSKASIQNLFSREDLKILMSNEKAEWLKKPALLYQDEDYFLKQFDIKELELKDLIAYRTNLFEKIYSQKTDDWYYKFFNELTDYRSYEISFLKTVKIIKLNNGDIESAINTNKQSDLYIVDEENKDVPEKLKVVSDCLYTKNEAKKPFVNQDILSVLEGLGVKTYNTEYQVDSRLEKYNQAAKISDDIIIEDMKIFLSFYKKNKNFIYKFKDRDFIKDNTSKFKKPSDLVLMDPYENTFYSKVKFVLDDIKYFSISNIYRQGLSDEELQLFISLMKDCNIKYKLIIEDGYVEDLEKFIAVKDVDLSVAIWQFFTKEIKNFRLHQYASNGYEDSQVFRLLKNEEWVPTKTNEFKKPSEIKTDELHPECYIDLKNGFLREINFGIKDKQNTENAKYFRDQLKKLGLNEDELDTLVEIKHLSESAAISLKDVLRYVLVIAKNQEQKKESSTINLPNKDKTNIRDLINTAEIKNAPTKTYYPTSSNRRWFKPQKEIYAYLIEQYENKEEDSMFCQICHNNMPFKTRYGHWYFEAVEIFNYAMFKLEDRAFYLSLCPVCAARYKEYVKTYSQSGTYNQLNYIKEKLLLGENNISIKMDIDGFIVFNNTHLLDIKTKLNAIKDMEASNSQSEQENTMEEQMANKKLNESETDETEIILDREGNDFDEGLDETEIVLDGEENNIDEKLDDQNFTNTEANNLGWD